MNLAVDTKILGVVVMLYFFDFVIVLAECYKYFFLNLSPLLFRLDRIASSLSIPKKAEFVKLLAAYWMLKRQSRNGVPLLRRLQSYNQNREKVVVSI